MPASGPTKVQGPSVVSWIFRSVCCAASACIDRLRFTGVHKITITLEDICWLREAALKRGTTAIPAAIAKKLVAAQLIVLDPRGDCMRTTKRGELALNRLG